MDVVDIVLAIIIVFLLYFTFRHSWIPHNSLLYSYYMDSLYDYDDIMNSVSKLLEEESVQTSDSEMEESKIVNI